MGLELHIQATKPVSWPSVAEHLVRLGEVPHLRMIDNLPAFPDETPPDDWADLRIGLQGGMITLRRTATGFTCIAWGNAGETEKRSWQALASAVAAAADGRIIASE